MEENIANDLNTIIELLREISAKLDQKPYNLLIEDELDWVADWADEPGVATNEV